MHHIRRRLLLPALAVGVSLAGLAVLRAFQSRNTQIELAKANTRAIARSSALSLDATIAGTRSLLVSLRELQTLHLSRAENDSILSRVNGGSTIPFADLRIFDTTGVLLGASNYQNNGPAPPGMLQRPMFRRARATRAFTIGSVRRAATLPGQPLLLSFVLPVIDSASRAISSYVSAAIFVDSMRTVKQMRDLPAGSVLTLLDSSGTITYRSLDTDRWLGRTATTSDSATRVDAVAPGESVAAVSRAEDGIERLIGIEHLTEAPWALHLGVPVEPTLRIARRDLRNDLIAGALLVLVVLALCYRAAIRIVGPVESLTTDVRAIADGDMARRSQIDSGDELGELARALNRMADTIVERSDALRLSQEQLLHSQKMDALGQMAGGIAHDFNNYLHVIMAHAELVKGNVHPDSEDERDLHEVITTAERAAALTRQILVFSRKQVMVPTVQDLNAIISGVARLLRRVAGDDRDLTFHLSEQALPVFIDAGAFEQVLVNLVSNARDATRASGVISITTRTSSAPNADATAPLLEVAEVLVADDGVGIAKAARERIFDPYFTTKERGHGTGLGLSIVYGIVTQAGGSIEVESEPAHGTTFRLAFPITQDASSTPHAPGIDTPLERGDEVVLVVDDDPDVLRSTERMLEQAGYRTRVAPSAADALELLARDPSIDLLLTDVSMPGMPGTALAAIVRERHRGLPVLFMTAYADDAALRVDPGVHSEAFILKPFSARDLAAQVRRALQGAAASQGS